MATPLDPHAAIVTRAGGMPPAEPPAQLTEPGSAFSISTSWLMSWISDAVGTTIASYSPVRRAMGVTSARLTGELLVRTAPTMT